MLLHDKKGAFLHKEKVLPSMADRSLDYFSYNDSSFAIQKCKESTGRVSSLFKIQSKALIEGAPRFFWSVSRSL